jgi:hypothetical protein
MLKIIQFYNFFGSTKRVLHFKTFLAKWNGIGAKICFKKKKKNSMLLVVRCVHCNQAFVGNVCEM